MKRKTILAILIGLAACLPAAAMETGGSFSIGNNNLTAEPLTGTSFPGTEFPWGAELYWKKDATDNSGISVGFSRDPLFKNIGYTNFYYKEDLFEISVGPFFGVFNTLETLIKSGISTSMRLNVPGIAFAQFRTQSTIGGRLVTAGDYLQEANNIAVGFYVYNAICTVTMDTKSYSYINAAGSTIAEDFTEYAFSTDIFQKNMPYTILLKLAYQSRVRTIDANSLQSLNSIVLGTDFSLFITDYLNIFLGLESCLYTFGFQEKKTPVSKELLTFSSDLPGSYLFNASVGFSLDLDSLGF